MRKWGRVSFLFISVAHRCELCGTPRVFDGRGQSLTAAELRFVSLDTNATVPRPQCKIVQTP